MSAETRAAPLRWFKFPRSDWTEERTTKLRELNELGMSASQIARSLGYVSRCAVIGKLSRLGIKSKNPPNLPREQRAKPVRNGGAEIAKIKARRLAKEREIASRTNDTRARSAMVARARAAGELEPFIQVDEPAKTNRRLLAFNELAHKHCRWPYTTTVGTRGTLYCGKTALPNKPYCNEHASMAYQPPQPLKERQSAAVRRKLFRRTGTGQ